MYTMLIYGIHAVQAALDNPKRHCRKLWVTKDTQKRLTVPDRLRQIIAVTDRANIDQRIGKDITHQGVALEVEPLATPTFEDVVENAGRTEKATIVILDQITDPHNVGAILRSCAAFNVSALILPKDNAPDRNNPIIIKNACGATERVPLIYVGNLSRSMEYLKKNGFWCVGLDERGKQNIKQLKPMEHLALVMGSEGEGMRRLTAENCDLLVRLPTNPDFPTLNVSNAAAIALYAMA
jgi:23S rRNA (guanosine2251-2'-O)-methyltransferase